MHANFNSVKFTLMAISFFLFCIYNAGYFTPQPTPSPNYFSKDNIDYVNSSKYKVAVDNMKPMQEMTYWEKAALKFLNYKSNNMVPAVLYKPGITLEILLDEQLEGEAHQEDPRKLFVTIGAKQVPSYIETSLLSQQLGEEKEFTVYDDSIKKKRFIKLKLIKEASKHSSNP